MGTRGSSNTRHPSSPTSSKPSLPATPAVTEVSASRHSIPMPSQALTVHCTAATTASNSPTSQTHRTSPIVAEPKVHLVQRTEPGRFHARTGCRFAEARSMHPNCKLHHHHATPFGPTFRPRAIRPRLLRAVEELRAACPVEAAPTPLLDDSTTRATYDTAGRHAVKAQIAPTLTRAAPKATACTYSTRNRPFDSGQRWPHDLHDSVFRCACVPTSTAGSVTRCLSYDEEQSAIGRT